jgi:glycogen operon protein
MGSPDIYGHKEREPEQSINFITCHDGFTLNDLVSYNCKHNEANREENRDGSNDNFSWNCGIEGPTDDPVIESLRNKQVKNFLVALLSISTPMILMGDEVRRTQYGNNNAYCQNNELSWFDWGLPERHSGIHRFVKYLIHIRLQRDVSKPEHAMSLNQLLQKRSVDWHGVKLNQPDWSYESHSIAFTTRSLSGGIMWHYMLNAYHEALEFELPEIKDAGYWKRWLDTALESPDDICYPGDASIKAEKKYLVQPRSTVVLIAMLPI